ncbi:hypothetical protein ACEQ8H_005007 [Pleosporales sp. CAS-2024a]
MLEKALHTVTHRKERQLSPFTHTWRNHPVGYPRLAERIAVKPETGIYRRFDALNARRVLYLQAELGVLQDQLWEVEIKDSNSKVGQRSRYAFDYKSMWKDPTREESLQWKLLEKIHKKLNQYNKAMIQLSKLQKMKAPDRFDLSDVQRLLLSDDMGPNKMEDEAKNVWGNHFEPDVHPPDLIGIRPRENVDKFSRFISEKAIHLFKCGLGRLTKGDKHLGRNVYYDSTVAKVTMWITSAIAALIPIASILVLVHLHSLKLQLWTIAAFNVLISICLTIFTDAKRTDAFAVNAA